mgnify:CR=1 FL=1
MPISAQDAGIIAITVSLIGVDVLVRYLQVLAHEKWDWGLAGQFVGSHILPKVGGLIAAAIMQYLTQHGGWSSIATTAVFYGGAAAVDVSLIKDIIAKLQQFGLLNKTTGTGSTGAGSGAA